jgi:arylsulfatase A-like enzyme
MLTALYPLEHGVVHSTQVLEDRNLTMAEAFSAGGYRTGAFVSTSILRSDYGFSQGFDEYDDRVETAHGEGQFERDARSTTDRALTWLEEDDRRPFFLWIHYFDAHAPYRDRAGAAPASEASGPLPGSYAQLDALERGKSADDLAAELPEIRRLYAAEIRYVDEQIGRLLEALAERGDRDGILLVVGSDHGEELFDHGFFHGHYRSLTESVLRVPLIFSMPSRIASGKRVSRVVENVDILPTVLSIVGLPALEQASGRDLSSDLRSDAAPASGQQDAQRLAWSMREPYTNMPGGQAIALRDWRWKAIFYSHAPTEIFDLRADPGERNNLASSELERVESLRQQLVAWVSGEPLPERDQSTLDPEDYEILKALGYVEE